MQPIYNEIQKFESMVFEEQKTERLEKLEIGIKTKNPLYNPIKWIETKNPDKWIKNKKSAYSPNKYTSITTYLAIVQGYKVKAWIDRKIQLTPYDGNKFNVKISLKTEGWVSFTTEYTPPIIRNPFSGKLIAEFNIKLVINLVFSCNN